MNTSYMVTRFQLLGSLDGRIRMFMLFLYLVKLIKTNKMNKQEFQTYSQKVLSQVENVLKVKTEFSDSSWPKVSCDYCINGFNFKAVLEAGCNDTKKSCYQKFYYGITGMNNNKDIMSQDLENYPILNSICDELSMFPSENNWYRYTYVEAKNMVREFSDFLFKLDRIPEIEKK